MKISKSLLGGLQVSYDCPNCGTDLLSPLKDAGKVDSCPRCGIQFHVPGTQELENEKRRKQTLAEQKQLKASRKARVAEKRRTDKSLEQQARAEERRQQMASPPSSVETSGELPQPQPVSPQAVGPKNNITRSILFGVGGIIFLCLAIATAIYSFNSDSGAGVTDLVQSHELRTKLKTCPSNDTVEVDVYYEGLVSTKVVVFDLLDGSSAGARRIDPIHLLFEFSDELDLYSVEKVILARNGDQKFYIPSSKLRRLTESYVNGGEPWAFNHLPESVRSMSGAEVYGEWTGGVLGVLKEQTEDLNDFIEEWTGY